MKYFDKIVSRGVAFHEPPSSPEALSHSSGVEFFERVDSGVRGTSVFFYPSLSSSSIMLPVCFYVLCQSVMFLYFLNFED